MATGGKSDPCLSTDPSDQLPDKDAIRCVAISGYKGVESQPIECRVVVTEQRMRSSGVPGRKVDGVDGDWGDLQSAKSRGLCCALRSDIQIR